MSIKYIKRFLSILILFPFIFSACIEVPEEEEQEEKPATPPVLSLSYTLIGSYSAQFVCDIESEDRMFIKGEFEYSQDPSFKDAQKALGIVMENVLSITVTDLEDSKTYYVRATVADYKDSYVSETISFESVCFNLSGDEFHIGWQGGDISFDVTTKDDVNLDITDTEWISAAAATKAFPTYSKVFHIEPNTSLAMRESFIKVSSTDGYFKKTLHIVQDGSPIPVDDEHVKKYLLEQYDKNADGGISLDEVSDIKEIEVVGDDIQSLDVIKYLPGLERLVCKGTGPQTGALSEVDLSFNPELAYIDLSNNKLTGIDISCCPNLKGLDCSGNLIEAIDLSDNEPLESVNCSGNVISSLDLTYNTSLTVLDCGKNRITSISGNRSTALKSLSCNDNLLDSLDVRKNKGLEHLDCGKNNLTSLDLRDNDALKALLCQDNQLSGLTLRRNISLDSLFCNGNPIAILNVSYNTELTHLNCSRTDISSLDISKNKKLEYLDCSDTDLAYLDICGLPALESLFCNSSSLTTLFIEDGRSLKGITADRDEEHISPGTIVRSHEGYATIEDPVFKEYLLKYYDTDKDGNLSLDEALSITSVNICTDNVRTLKGISALTNLRYLSCEGTYDHFGNTNGKLVELDLSGNHQLEQLICDSNRLTSLDLSSAPKLRTLWCFRNNLTSLDLSGNPALADLNCEFNQISSLDLSSNAVLASLDCSPMNDSEGKNCLESVTLSEQRIKYINDRTVPRSPSNIPSQTKLNFTVPFPMDFMFNFNSKQFDKETNTISNASGAMWSRNLVLSKQPFYVYSDHIGIEYGNCMEVHFSSPMENPFNRDDEHRTLTLIAKVAGNDMDHISLFSNRGTEFNYMFREGESSTRYFYLHDSRSYGYAPYILADELPATVVVRAGSDGNLTMMTFKNGEKTSTSTSPQGWGMPSDGIGFFCGGYGQGEYWSGDFYWMFMSLEELSDEEILNVIEYNEEMED